MISFCSKSVIILTVQPEEGSLSMKQSIDTIQRQSMIVSASQVQFLQMLAMNSQELEQWLEVQFTENPLLEKDVPAESPLSCLSPISHTSSRDDVRSFPEPFFLEGQTIYHFLTEQLRYSDYSDRDWDMITFLICNLDEKGFFTLDLDQTASEFPRAALERHLNTLRELEPYGIFSPNMATCYLKQLHKLQLGDSLLQTVVAQDLDDLLHRRMSRLSRKYHLTSRQVQDYHQILSQLSPYPLFHFQTGNICRTIPDIICRYQGSDLIPELYTADSANYTIHAEYYRMMRQSQDPVLREYLSQKYTLAKQILRNIENRRDTLLRLTTVILEKQAPFFRHRGELLPMNMSQIGELCGVSTSTVSRAIRDKYLQYPGGIIRMRELFVSSSSQDARQENTVSPETVKKIIGQIISAENPRKPLSDDQICAILSSEDISVSRRTVAKYRSALCIPTSRERKER